MKKRWQRIGAALMASFMLAGQTAPAYAFDDDSAYTESTYDDAETEAAYDDTSTELAYDDDTELRSISGIDAAENDASGSAEGASELLDDSEVSADKEDNSDEIEDTRRAIEDGEFDNIAILNIEIPHGTGDIEIENEQGDIIRVTVSDESHTGDQREMTVLNPDDTEIYVADGVYETSVIGYLGESYTVRVDSDDDSMINTVSFQADSGYQDIGFSKSSVSDFQTTITLDSFSQTLHTSFYSKSTESEKTPIMRRLAKALTDTSNAFKGSSTASDEVKESDERYPNGKAPSELQTGGTVVNIYGEDTFDEEYSNGYIDLRGSKAAFHGFSKVSSIAGNYPIVGTNAQLQELIGGGLESYAERLLLFTNTSRSDQVYIDYEDGAVVNGKRVNVRVYPWLARSDTWYKYGPSFAGFEFENDDRVTEAPESGTSTVYGETDSRYRGQSLFRNTEGTLRIARYCIYDGDTGKAKKTGDDIRLTDKVMWLGEEHGDGWTYRTLESLLEEDFWMARTVRNGELSGNYCKLIWNVEPWAEVDNQIKMEFHFYDKTTGSEIPFKGVLKVVDLDANEGIYINQGLVTSVRTDIENEIVENDTSDSVRRGIWLNQQTVLRYDKATGAWRGSYETGAFKEEEELIGFTTEWATAWFEVEGSANQPLMLTYYVGDSHGAKLIFAGQNVNYHIVENEEGLPSVLRNEVIPTVGTSEYARYRLVDATEDEYFRTNSLDNVDEKNNLLKYYAFSGWYHESDLMNYVTEARNKSGNVITVKDENGNTVKTRNREGAETDQTVQLLMNTGSRQTHPKYDFYGTYYRVATEIQAEVVNGTIDPNVDPAYFHESYTVNYTPNDGYILKSIIVDGEPLSENEMHEFSDSYEFKDLKDLGKDDAGYSLPHTIKVVYANASVEKHAYLAGSDRTGAYYQRGTNIDGKFVSEGDRIQYKITYNNPTKIARDITLVDTLPKGIKLINASVSDGGVKSNDKIIWELKNIGAEESGIVTYEAEVTADAAGTDGENVVDYTLHKQSASSTEQDIHAQDQVNNPVMEKPVKEVKQNGVSVNGKHLKAKETVQYEISFTNPHSEEKEFTVTDKIPDGMEYVPQDTDTCVLKEGVLTWTAVKVGAGETVHLSFTAKVAEAVTVSKISNCAFVAADQVLIQSNTVTNLTDKGDDEEEELPTDLHTVKMVLDEKGNDIHQIVKSVGQTIYYEINVKNDTEQARVYTIEDQFVEDLDNIRILDTLGGQLTDHKAVWEVTIPTGEAVTLRVSAMIGEGAAGSTMKNSAVVTVDGESAKTNTVETPVMDDPIKDVFAADRKETSVNNEMVGVGQELTYTITFTNPSSETKEAVITDILPDEVEFVSASDNGVLSGNHKVTWKLAEVKANESKTVSVTVRVLQDAVGKVIKNRATVGIDQALVETVTKSHTENPELPAKDSETENFVPKKEVLDVDENSIDGQLVETGDEITYLIHYKNSGNDARTVVITDELPDGVTFLQASNHGSCKEDTVTWKLANVEPGKTGAVSVRVKIAENAGTVINTAAVKTIDSQGNESDPAKTNEVTVYANTEIAADPVKEVFGKDGADLDGQKVNSGEEVTYRITVKNPTEKEQRVTITDQVDALLVKYIRTISDEGTIKDGLVTWNLTIPAGEEKAVTISTNAPNLRKERAIENKATVTFVELTDEKPKETNTVTIHVQKGEAEKAGDDTDGKNSSENPDGSGKSSGSVSGVSGKVDNTPKTGDTSFVALWIVFVCILFGSGAGVLIYFGRKKHSRR